MCYTYDSVGKVLSRTVKNLLDDTVISTETFTYDSAGNITDAPDLCFEYDTNNRLTKFCNNTVSYALGVGITFSFNISNKIINTIANIFVS